MKFLMVLIIFLQGCNIRLTTGQETDCNNACQKADYDLGRWVADNTCRCYNEASMLELEDE